MILKAPISKDLNPYSCIVFLSGAIDMGKAVNWQAEVEQAIDAPDIAVLNPRRDDWDHTWKQEMSDPQFRKQVEWEIGGLDVADAIIVVFTKDSKAPITFLEFGWKHEKAIVVVEPGFYRKGNIDIFCDILGIPKFESLQEGIEALKENIRVVKLMKEKEQK